MDDSSQKQTIDFIKQLDLSEEDLEKYYDTFSRLFDQDRIIEIVERLASGSRNNDEGTVEDILRYIQSNLTEEDLEILDEIVRKNSKFLEEFQDLILEKLLG